MFNSICEKIVSCETPLEETITSSQLNLSLAIQSFCKEATSFSSIFTLCAGQMVGAFAKSECFRLLPMIFGNQSSKIPFYHYASIGVACVAEGIAFNSASTLAKTGDFKLGLWQENLHGTFSILTCKVIGVGLPFGNIVVQHCLQDFAFVTIDLSFEKIRFIESKTEGLIERMMEAEIASIRMECSAKLTGILCVKTTYYQAKQNLSYEIRKGGSKKSLSIDLRDNFELFGLKPVTPNGAPIEVLREIQKAEKQKRAGMIFSERKEDPFPLLQMVFPRQPEKVREVLESFDIDPNVKVETISMTQLPKWLTQLHQQLDQFLKGKEKLSTDEKTGFRLLAEYTAWTNEGNFDYTTLPLLYEKSFERLKVYFSSIAQFSREQMEYHKKTALKDAFADNKEREFLFHRVLTLYLAHRNRVSGSETFLKSVVCSVLGILHPYYKSQKKLLIEYHQVCIDFLTRRIAADDFLMSRYSDLVHEQFPLATYYQSGKRNQISLEEVESIRKSHLPKTTEKSTFMLVGIGAEWSQVERYAKAGHHLVLVDPASSVAEFFKEKQKELEQLEQTYQIRIRYEQAEFEAERLIKDYQGQIDCIEYQNTIAVGPEQAERIDQMLRPGGLFVQFNPSPITQPDDIVVKEFGREGIFQKRPFSNKQNYTVILDKKNIPALLGTLSERLAYPIGNHLFMIKKSGEKTTAPSLSSLMSTPLKPISDYKTPEGLPLLDLPKMSQANVVEHILNRSFQWNLELQADLMKNKDFSEVAIQDIVAIATYKKLSTHELLKEKGIPPPPLESPMTAQIRRVENIMRDYFVFLERQINQKLGPLSISEKEKYLRAFFELAITVPRATPIYLRCIEILTKNLSDSGKQISWEELIKMHAETRSSFEKELIQVISQRGEVPFDDYFRLTMFELTHALYTGPEAVDLLTPSPQGYFVTSSYFGSFGKTLLRFIRNSWEKLGKPQVFDLVEMGAGRGVLAHTILTELASLASENREWREFDHAVQYHIVELSPALIEIQKQTIASAQRKVVFHNQSAIDGKLPLGDFYFSNEMLDMIPPVKLVNLNGVLQEVYIIFQGGLLQEITGPLRSKTKDFLTRHPLYLKRGEVYYIQPSLEDWVKNMERYLKDRGYLLSIDYGDKRENLRKTRNAYLRTMFRGLNKNDSYETLLLPFIEATEQHREYPIYPFSGGQDPYGALTTYRSIATANAYQRDLTPDVDFTALEESHSSLTPILYQKQAAFLNAVMQRNNIRFPLPFSRTHGVDSSNPEMQKLLTVLKENLKRTNFSFSEENDPFESLLDLLGGNADKIKTEVSNSKFQVSLMGKNIRINPLT